MRRATLVELFDDLPETRDEWLAYDNGYRRWSRSYADVKRAARAFAARLAGARPGGSSLAPGDRILVWSENRPEWVVAFWGAVLARLVVVPVDAGASFDFVERVRRIVGARLVLAGDEVARPAASGSEADAPDWWSLAALEWPEGRGARPAGDVRPSRLPPASPDDLAEIIFTSGATADPKGVLISHRNLLANVEPIEREVAKYRRALRLMRPLRFLDLLPLSHLFGQSLATFIPPLVVGTAVFMHGHNPADVARLVRGRRITLVVGVPMILELLQGFVERRARSAAEGADRGEHWVRRWWRYREVHRLFGPRFWGFIVGAAPLGEETERFWSRTGFLVIQGYGLTETAPIVSLNHPLAIRRGSAGTPIEGVEVRIAPDGEILVRGENVSAGYFGAPPGEAARREDGWLATGDIGEIDGEGRLFVRGRKKEMIVTPDGLNVFPEEVERVLSGLPGVVEAAVVGEPSARGERPHAVLVLEAGAEAGEIARRANERLADHQRLHGATRWPGGALPRTEGTRKLRRGEVRRWLVEGREAVRVVAPVDPVGRALSRVAGARAATIGTSAAAAIDAIGLSSLERVELLMRLEEESGAAIDERAFAAARTIGDLRALSEARRAEVGAGGEPLARGPEARPAVDEGAAVQPIPAWPRRLPARVARAALHLIIVRPAVRWFAPAAVEGLEKLPAGIGPVIFAANHQSHFDTPLVYTALPARWRRRLAVAMAREFFAPYFHPEPGWRWTRLWAGLLYQLALLGFNAFPLPQREAGARQAIRHVGDLVSEGWSPLVFPEGRRTDAGGFSPFQAGVALMSSRLGVSVVPVRLSGVHRVWHRSWRWPRRGRVRVAFGEPLILRGDDYASLARRVQEAVERLPGES